MLEQLPHSRRLVWPSGEHSRPQTWPHLLAERLRRPMVCVRTLRPRTYLLSDTGRSTSNIDTQGLAPEDSACTVRKAEAISSCYRALQATSIGAPGHILSPPFPRQHDLSIYAQVQLLSSAQLVTMSNEYRGREQSLASDPDMNITDHEFWSEGDFALISADGVRFRIDSLLLCWAR